MPEKKTRKRKTIEDQIKEMGLAQLIDLHGKVTQALEERKAEISSQLKSLEGVV